MLHNILISTECVADIPNEILKATDIKMIYFDIERMIQGNLKNNFLKGIKFLLASL